MYFTMIDPVSFELEKKYKLHLSAAHKARSAQDTIGYSYNKSAAEAVLQQYRRRQVEIDAENR